MRCTSACRPWVWRISGGPVKAENHFHVICMRITCVSHWGFFSWNERMDGLRSKKGLPAKAVPSFHGCVTQPSGYDLTKDLVPYLLGSLSDMLNHCL